MGALWMLFWAYLVMAVAYLLISVYSRSVRKEKLEDAWDEGGQVGTRDDHVQRGLEAYDQSFRRKAIALVFLIPIVLIAGITILTNMR